VWSRAAGLPDFLKLYGVIENGLDAGTYTLRVNNVWDESFFPTESKKQFVLQQTNIIGGQNFFLASCYIFVGCVCLVFAVIFTFAYVFRRYVAKPKLL
jgi:hypothetical protein